MNLLNICINVNSHVSLNANGYFRQYDLFINFTIFQQLTLQLCDHTH